MYQHDQHRYERRAILRRIQTRQRRTHFTLAAIFMLLAILLLSLIGCGDAPTSPSTTRHQPKPDTPIVGTAVPRPTP